MTGIFKFISEKPKAAFYTGIFLLVSVTILLLILAYTKQSVKVPGMSIESQFDNIAKESSCLKEIKEINLLIDSSIKTKFLPKQYEFMTRCKENSTDLISQKKLNEINTSILELNVIKYSELARCETECINGKLVSLSLQNLKADALKIIENSN